MLVMGLKSLHDFFEVAPEHLVQLVDGQSDPMIGDPVLRKIIGTNLFTSIAGSNLRLPVLRNFGLLFLALCFDDLGAEPLVPWASSLMGPSDQRPATELAAELAGQRRRGLEAWGITPERLRQYNAALGLRVLAGDGAPVGWLPAVVRNLMRTVDMLPFGYAAGLVSCLCDRHGRRLGDLVADTVVVHVLPRQSPPRLPQVLPLAPSQRLLADEQVAIVAFGERAPHLSAGRQAELAGLLHPLTGSAGAEGVHRLYGIAAWLLGRR